VAAIIEPRLGKGLRGGKAGPGIFFSESPITHVS
jgi:hypothetical protein